MKESVSYQMILDEGEERGLKKGYIIGEEKGFEKGTLEAFRESLFDILEARFGIVSDAVRRRIHAADDVAKLRAATKNAIIINSADDLVI